MGTVPPPAAPPQRKRRCVPLKPERVVLGLSGGVDSAAAARLLLDRGFAVTAVYLDNGLPGRDAAAALARELGVPFLVRDISAPLEERVCAYFDAAYRAGCTPLPCAVCNATVKFPALFAVAEETGAAFVATGHYARTQGGRLFRGRPANDQSYFLARLTPAQLERVLFPLEDLEKAEVRARAAGWGLSVAEKPDSMELCFIPDNDYAAWLEARWRKAGQAPPPPGNFVDPQGRVLGLHRGLHRYTLGQNRRLGLSGPHKYFVSGLFPETNEVRLSDGSDLSTQTVLCQDPNWLVPPQFPLRAAVRFRHSRQETPATLILAGDPLPDQPTPLLVRTDVPVRAPTPGQLAVFYDGPAVLGSAWIAPPSGVSPRQQ